MEPTIYEATVKKLEVRKGEVLLVLDMPREAGKPRMSFRTAKNQEELFRSLLGKKVTITTESAKP